MHPTHIEIDAKQFVTNLKAIATYLTKQTTSQSRSKPEPKICLPVKANAYGHGLVAMAALAQMHVDYLAVSCLDEGIILRENNITCPILVFGISQMQDIANSIKHNLEITVVSLAQVDKIGEIAKRLNTVCKVHLKVDTGMQRIGIAVDAAYTIIDAILTKPELVLMSVYSHLACSDEADSGFTLQQVAKFKPIAEYVQRINPYILCHIANSGALCSYPEAFFDMVRPGILSYGYFPDNANQQSISGTALAEIKPCFSLKSKVSYSKMVEPHQGISYNLRYTTKECTQIVTIPIGYGDGYRRCLSNCGEVLIGGDCYLVSGTVCMDMLMVDVGQIKDKLIFIDDEVVLIGSQGDLTITLESVAHKCNTITYEILCGFTSRIPRVYLD